MATSLQWLERTETVYQKRLQKISEVLISEGTASKRFKGIQSLVDMFEWNDSSLNLHGSLKRQESGGMIVTDEHDPMDLAWEEKLVAEIKAIAAPMPESAPSSMSPAPVKRSSVLTLTPEKEALIAKNKAAALAAKEEKARQKAEDMKVNGNAKDQQIFAAQQWLGY